VATTRPSLPGRQAAALNPKNSYAIHIDAWSPLAAAMRLQELVNDRSAAELAKLLAPVFEPDPDPLDDPEMP
jgi:hypothetical protein